MMMMLFGRLEQPFLNREDENEKKKVWEWN